MGSPEYDATTLTQSHAEWRPISKPRQKPAASRKLAGNWIMGEVSRRLNASELSIEQTPVTSAQLASLVSRINDARFRTNARPAGVDAIWMGEGADVDAL